eukprot:g1852.t1
MRQALNVSQIRYCWKRNLDIESRNHPDYNVPQQGVPYFNNGGSPGFCQRTLDVDGKEWAYFKSKSLGRVESCEFSAIQQVDIKLERLMTAPTMSNRSSRLFPNRVMNSKLPKHKSIIGLPVLSPFSAVANYWLAIIAFVDLTFTAFLVPLLTAFVGEEQSSSTLLLAVDFVSGAVFLFDVFIKFHIGFLIQYTYHRKVEMRGRNVCWYYFIHGGAWIDIISVLPSLIGLLAKAIHSNESILHLLRYIRMIRLVRILRAIKTVNQYLVDGSGFSTRINSQAVYFIGVIYVLAILVNFLGCLLYFVAVVQDSDLDGTWISAYVDDMSGKTKEYYYLLSVYWAITTLTTVGFGDVTPKTASEMIIMSFMMVTQIVIFGFLIAAITQVVTDSLKQYKNADALKEKKSEIQRWLSNYEFPDHLVKAVEDYYSQVWVRKQEVDEQLLLSEIPRTLRCSLVYSLTGKLMEDLPLFKFLRKDAKVRLAVKMDPSTKYPAEDLTYRGQKLDCLFILEDGILKMGNRKQSSAYRSAPDVFGISSLLPSPSKSMEVFHCKLKAYSCCRLWTLKAEDLWDVVEQVEDDHSSLVKGIKYHLKDRAASLLNDEFALQRMFKMELGRNISSTRALKLKQLLDQDILDVNDLIVDDENEIAETCQDEPEITKAAMSAKTRSPVEMEDRMPWEQLLTTLRQYGVHGVVEFLNKVSSVGNQYIDKSLFSALVESYNLSTIGFDAYSITDRSGRKLINAQTIVNKLLSFHDSSRREVAIIETFRSKIKGIEDRHQGLELITLVNFYHPENHPNVHTGHRNKSSVLGDLVTFFKHIDYISEKEFITFHKCVSLSVTDDEDFTSYLQTMWLSIN